jgi:hypothetical protein
MPYWVDQLCDGVTAHWMAATMLDYGRIVLVIVACGWVLSRRWTT